MRYGIDEANDLHHYSFKFDGDVIYRRCKILTVKPKKDGIEVCYVPYDNPTGMRYYVDARDINEALSNCGNTKTVALDHPDFELAKRILGDHLRRRAEELRKVADRMEFQADRLETAKDDSDGYFALGCDAWKGSWE